MESLSMVREQDLVEIAERERGVEHPERRQGKL